MAGHFASAEALDQVKLQAEPDNWTIFPAEAGYFGGNIFQFLFGASFLAIVIGVCTVLVIQNGPYSFSDLWLMLAFLGAFGAGTIVLIWLAIRQFRELRTVKEQVLIITPEGFMVRSGGKPQNMFAVAFADLDAISLNVQHYRYWNKYFLQLGYNENWYPRRYAWRIPPQFRALDVIAQTIIESHARYTLEHPNQVAFR